MERPPSGIEYKTAALPAAITVTGARPRGIEQTVVILPIGVEQTGDVFEPGALADAMTRRTPKITIESEWNRPVGTVVSAVELPPGDQRLPATQPDGTPWPPSAGGLLLRLLLMPGTTRDSALAVKGLRRNGPRQRWQIGFRVLDGVQRGRLRRIRRLDNYSLSPHLGEVKAAGYRRQPGAPAMEVRTIRSGASLPLPTGSRWALVCDLCGQPAAMTSAPLRPDARLICRGCLDEVDRFTDPFAAPDLDDPQAPDPGPVAAYETALSDETDFDTNAFGEIRPGRRTRR